MAQNTSSPETEHEVLLKRVGRGLQELIEAVTNAREAAAKSQGLHPTDFSCIGYLSRIGTPVSPKQIIAHLNLTSGSGTALLDRLEAAGYTRRLPNPDDRRSLLIELNVDKAAEPLQRYREIEQSYREVTRGFSEADLAAIARFMEAMGTFTKQLP